MPNDSRFSGYRNLPANRRETLSRSPPQSVSALSARSKPAPARSSYNSAAELIERVIWAQMDFALSAGVKIPALYDAWGKKEAADDWRKKLAPSASGHESTKWHK